MFLVIISADLISIKSVCNTIADTCFQSDGDYYVILLNKENVGNFFFSCKVLKTDLPSYLLSDLIRFMRGHWSQDLYETVCPVRGWPVEEGLKIGAISQQGLLCVVFGTGLLSVLCPCSPQRSSGPVACWDMKGKEIPQSCALKLVVTMRKYISG